MQWRIDTIRQEDENSLISAHGTAQSLENMSIGGSDEWMAASPVEVYGLTFVQSRKGSEPWKQFNAVDLTRSGSRGKIFWHAEAQGGPLWLQPQVIGRERIDGRITTSEDVRLWNLTPLACGARGILYPRYRPLLDGPLFGAFAPYGMDGSRTPRSEMASFIARWANNPDNEELLMASPIKGDVGIIIVPEAQMASCLISKFGSEDNYRFMAMGAYKGFFDNNIQADWVYIDDIDRYSCLYLPYPIILKEIHAKKLQDWVKNGGKLVSEGCPGYFGDLGTVGEIQPNFGLNKMFGVNEVNVEFTPDILGLMEFRFDDEVIRGGEYVQTYETITAVPQGYCNNEIIAAANTYGKRKTILIGTCVSKGYYDSADHRTKIYFKKLLNWFGISQAVVVITRR